jgi:hypothetical protein
MANYYGTTDSIDGLRTLFATHLNTLMTAMASGYDPTFSYIYNYHIVAPLRLNAVTIGIGAGLTADMYGMDGGVGHEYVIPVELRVHTGYIGDTKDEQKIARLLQSLDNYFNTNKSLGSNYELMRTMSVDPNVTFGDSYTIGGSITFEVKIFINHVQA